MRIVNATNIIMTMITNMSITMTTKATTITTMRKGA